MKLVDAGGECLGGWTALAPSMATLSDGEIKIFVHITQFCPVCTTEYMCCVKQ